MPSLLELLALERPLIFLDAETTGPEYQTDRIVEIGFIQLKPDGSAREWQSYVNPTVPIPAEATYGNPEKGYDGHGITDEMVKDAPTWETLAPHLLRGFKDCDYGGYNIRRFDMPLLQAEFNRAGHSWSYADARLLDGFRLWQVGQKHTLSAASEVLLGRKHEGAHRALADVQTSLDVVAALLQLFPSLPRTLAQLHEVQWPSNPDALDPQGQIVWKDGVATMNFGKNWRGMRLDLMSRRNLEWIVSPDCAGANPTTKQICADALNGKFPRKEAK